MAESERIKTKNLRSNYAENKHSIEKLTLQSESLMISLPSIALEIFGKTPCSKLSFDNFDYSKQQKNMTGIVTPPFWSKIARILGKMFRFSTSPVFSSHYSSPFCNKICSECSKKRTFDWLKHNDFSAPNRKQRRCLRCYAVAI